MYSQMYMAEEELSVLHKFVEMADKQIACELDDDEKKILHFHYPSRSPRLFQRQNQNQIKEYLLNEKRRKTIIQAALQFFVEEA